MSYFRAFPLTPYAIGKRNNVVTDILRRNVFLLTIKDKIGLYSTISVREAEKPENFANRVYGDPNLYWIITLFNEIHDPYFDWPLSQNDLYNYCNNVYGVEGKFFVRHYERAGDIIGEYKEFNFNDPDFIWVPPTNPGPQDPTVYPVSFVEWEERLNDRRREVRVPKRDLVNLIIEEFERKISV